MIWLMQECTIQPNFLEQFYVDSVIQFQQYETECSLSCPANADHVLLCSASLYQTSRYWSQRVTAFKTVICQLAAGSSCELKASYVLSFFEFCVLQMLFAGDILACVFWCDGYI